MSLPFEVFDGEQLTVHHPDGDVEMVGPAWCLIDLANLSDPQSTSETNRIAPGQPGAEPLASLQEQLVTSCPLWLVGDVDRTGAAHGVAMQIGFRRNWRWLAGRLFVPDGLSPAFDATYTSVDPDEDEIEFRIQFGTPASEHRSPMQRTYRIPITLPDGALLGEVPA